MKLNEKTVIYGTRVILVPYEKEHVEKYHAWMQSKEILDTTASEPLTLENEFKMQESWREDEDKLTFIILSAAQIEDGHTELESMIGDVNLFLNDPEDDCCGEVEVMIAEERARLKGAATESLKLLMGYCYDQMHVSKFVAKIGKHNLKSYSLFKNKLKFKYESESEIFEEFTMQLIIDDKGRKVINVPFLALERNPNWLGDKEMPYLKPAEDLVLPKDVKETETEESKPEPIENLFLCTEADEKWSTGQPRDKAEETPEAKRAKIHFGGLNLKKKVVEEDKGESEKLKFAPDTFDEWWF